MAKQVERFDDRSAKASFLDEVAEDGGEEEDQTFIFDALRDSITSYGKTIAIGIRRSLLPRHQPWQCPTRHLPRRQELGSVHRDSR